jgi:hypothetical protein
LSSLRPSIRPANVLMAQPASLAGKLERRIRRASLNAGARLTRAGLEDEGGRRLHPPESAKLARKTDIISTAVSLRITLRTKTIANFAQLAYICLQLIRTASHWRFRAMTERRTSQVLTRLTETDRAWVDREAERHGLDASSFVRMTLRRVRTASEQASAPQAA